MILGQMPHFGKFFLVNRVIYSSLFVFYVSQSELCHLQCTVSVCARVHTIVCACEPHLLQKDGCIEFEDGSSTGSSPGAKFGENPKKKKAIAIYQKLIAMLFGVAPSAKNSDFTAKLRHLPSFFFLRHLLFFGVSTFVIYLRCSWQVFGCNGV